MRPEDFNPKLPVKESEHIKLIEIPARPIQLVDTNVMRHEYRELSEPEKLNMRQVKDAGVIFYTLCDAIGSSRELSLAKTKIEEAVMWATKHITR